MRTPRLNLFWLGIALWGIAFPSASAQTPPGFPPAVAGQRALAWDYGGLRPIPPAPAVGVHPRVFVGPDQRAEVCNRLTNTVAGQELLTNYIQRYTTLLKNPRSAYDSLPISIKTMPDGTARLGNVGFYNDPYSYYTNLIAGSASNLDVMISNKVAGVGAGDVYARTLAGEMALEALECWVLQGQAGLGTRATNLAVAMDTWAGYLLGRKDYTNVSANWMLGGGAAFAEAYDFNYGAMTSNQCARVRTALARIINPAPYYGVGLEPEAATSNWASLNTYWLIMIMAMEGETSAAVEGYDTNYFNTYFTNAMGSIYKFLTYGWHPSGEPYEGMGKGWFGGARQIAFARRGYNFFGHPHLRNFCRYDWPACLQPFGYAWTHYDLIGGGGQDNVRGLRYYTASDEIAMQWVYTNDPAAAFLWRNFATTAWRTNVTNGYQAFLDFRDSKFVVSSSYGEDLIEAACFVQNPMTNIDWNLQSAAVFSSLDFLDVIGSTVIGRSGADSNALAFRLHTRQDFGGHTYAERGGFAVSGLGRVWVEFPYALNYGQDSGYNSQVLVDDLAMYVTPQEGSKMRIPAKLAGWSEASTAVFATCDATYPYTWAWKWNNYPTNGSMTVDSGYQKETNCLNNFRRTNNRIPEAYGAIPLWQYPHWNRAGYLEGIERTAFNTMRQVIRTAGLVRGVRPYALVVDDIQKDAAPHVYKWLAQSPSDLNLKTGAALPTGFVAATDCVLQEAVTNGSRSLLVRILSPSNWSALTETLTNASNETFFRLTIATTNIAPAFKVLLYPLNPVDPIPTTTWTSPDTLAIQMGSQGDTFTFVPRAISTTDGRTVAVSEFILARSGVTLMDYRNQIEPFGATVAGASQPPFVAAAGVSAGTFSLTVTNGAFAGACLVMASTNAGLPLANWPVVATNWFDITGQFEFTDPVGPASTQRYYRLRLP